jgi:hypothetical protein
MTKFNGQLLALNTIWIAAKFVAALDFDRIRVGHSLNTHPIGSVASGWVVVQTLPNCAYYTANSARRKCHFILPSMRHYISHSR